MKVDPPTIPTWRDSALVIAQAGFAAALVAAVLLTEASTSAPLRRAFVAAVLAGCAATIGVAALYGLRMSFRVIPSPRSDGQLVTSGVYRWLRHPMYNAVLLVVLAVTTMHTSVGTLLVATTNVLFYVLKAHYEESLLIKRYPDYEAYRRKTIGVVPGW